VTKVSASAHGHDPDFLSDLAAKLAALLIEEGLPRERADAIARRQVDAVRRDWGGLKPYIPMGRTVDVQRRNIEIQRRWTGSNARELCREFEISEIHLRRIVIARRDR
jgi:Mor family transcriptional regulator